MANGKLHHKQHPLSGRELRTWLKRLGVDIIPKMIKRHHGGKFRLEIPTDPYNTSLVVRRLARVLRDLSPRFTLVVDCDAVTKSNLWRESHGLAPYEYNEDEEVSEDVRQAI